MKKYSVSIMLIYGLLAACKTVINPLNETSSSSQSAGNVSQFSHYQNVILIVGDDMGYEVPTCDGGESYETPSMDKMAANGRKFTQCHSSPFCSPSRFALLTGKYNFRNYFDWGYLDLSQKTIANIFHNAGYKTYVSGKWQLGGGDISVHTFGFDNYCLWNATGSESEQGSRYKNPKIYKNGHVVDSELTLNKYGEDIFCHSVLNFIDSNKNNRFFVYYAMVNTHTPFSPTPDDAEFATWDPNDKGDNKFFPSMVKYADKKIGAIIDKINKLGLTKNTVIIYMGDNGTARKITSIFNGQSYSGGKTETNENGTHVPCLFWGGNVAQGVDSSLICFEDFYPTLADIAGISSSGYSILDGKSFYSQVIGANATPRQWIYNYYIIVESSISKDTTLTEWVQDYIYKLDLVDKAVYTFRYVGSEEVIVNPTPQQKQIRQAFKSIIDSIHKQQ